MPSHRSDFARNERRILDAAARLLAAAPAAGMGEIAAAAGLGRATLYRHFPTREALIDGLRRDALEAVAAVVERHRDADAPADALRRLAEELVDVGDRYRILLAEPGGEPATVAARRRFEEPLRALAERAQAAGELDPAPPAEWLPLALGGVLDAAFRAIAEGRLTAADAKRLVVRAAVDGFARGDAARTPPADAVARADRESMPPR